MSEPFVGEIRMFAGNFAPRGWAYCDGQLLAVSQSDALFSLLGTIYGGDGRTTFGLPDFRGRIPIHQGDGPGLTSRRIGSKGGSENVTITTSEMPSHTHDYQASRNSPELEIGPVGNYLSGNSNMAAVFPVGLPEPVEMSNATIQNTGGTGSHTNMMPALCIHYIIALVGIYPSRH